MLRGVRLAAFAAVLSVLPGLALADGLADIKARGSLTCGVLNNFEPYAFQDPQTRQPVGYEIDFCRALAADLGVGLNLKVISTQGRLPELLQGRVDVLAALVSYGAERAKQIDFSAIYISVANRFTVRGDPGIKTVADLDGKKVGVSKGSLLEKLMRERMPRTTVVSFDDKSASYLALKTGRVDAILTVVDVLMAFKNRDPEGDAMRVIPTNFFVSNDSFNVKKNEPELLAAINAFLARAEQSGLAAKIFEKWFGQGTDYKMIREFTVGVQPTE